MKRASVSHQVKTALEAVFAPGQSRYSLKGQSRDMVPIVGIATMRDYVKAAGKFARWCQAEYDVRWLRDISPAMAADYLQHLRDRELSGGHLGKVKAAIRKLDRAVRVMGWRAADAPEWLPAGGGWHSDARPERAYTPEQAEALITALTGTGDPQVALVVRLQCVAGLRVAEAAMLRGVDIDAETRTLHLRRGTKGGRERTLIVDPQYREFLGELQQRATAHRDGHVFQGRGDRGSSLIKRVETAVAAACQTLGIPCCGTHGFRKTYAQGRYAEVRAAGESDHTAREQVSQELGHSRVSVTYSYVPKQ